MVLNLILLFLSGIAGIFLLVRPSGWLQDNFKLAIGFAGGFLLSITLLHMLPDLFQSSLGSFYAGLLVLAGFFLQQFLEYITDGAEHGHFHKPQNSHDHKSSFALMILVGLTVHSFLEGTILSIPENSELSTSSRSLLAGIILHKIPASLALASLIACAPVKRLMAVSYMMIFALASPIGLLSGMAFDSLNNGSTILLAMLGLVCGNFLHISTTIVFEGSPGHKLNFQRLIWSLAGAAVAIAAELLN